jgi:hypothetical protein
MVVLNLDRHDVTIYVLMFSNPTLAHTTIDLKRAFSLGGRTFSSFPAMAVALKAATEPNNKGGRTKSLAQDSRRRFRTLQREIRSLHNRKERENFRASLVKPNFFAMNEVHLKLASSHPQYADG